MCNEHFYTSGGPNDATNVSPPSFLTIPSPSIVILSELPHHCTIPQQLTRSFSHCCIQSIVQDATHTPLALVVLQIFLGQYCNLAATVTRDGSTVGKVATAMSSSATAMYVFSSRLFSSFLLSSPHVHPLS